jgi:hypothetical protein
MHYFSELTIKRNHFGISETLTCHPDSVGVASIKVVTKLSNGVTNVSIITLNKDDTVALRDYLDKLIEHV